MKRLPVDIPPDVVEQIHEQMIFIAQDSVENALAWEDRLLAAIHRIGDLPGHAIDQDASDRLGDTIRKVVFEGTYLIHYCVDAVAGIVHIINFRHGARLSRDGEP